MSKKGYKHLNDAEQKQLIVLYSELGNCREVSKIVGCSETTVRRTIAKRPEVAEMVHRKKEENTKNILEFIDDRNAQHFKFLQDIFEHAKEKLPKASFYQSVICWGIIFDKLLACEEFKALRAENKTNSDALESLKSVMEELPMMIDNPPTESLHHD